MISIEAWRGRIGVWEGRVKLSSMISAPKMVLTLRQTLDILWGISTLLVAAVLVVLLIVGGVEINPGTPRKDLSSSSEEEIEVPKGLDFGGNSEDKYVFSAPLTSIPKMQKRRVLVGSKKRPNKFRGHVKCEMVALAPECSIAPTASSQISVTESLDVLELSAKVPRISVETQNETISFLDSQEHQETPLPESQPKLRTAQSKISPIISPNLPLEEMEIFHVGKSRGEKQNLCRFEGNAKGALAEVSVCKFCSKGRLIFYRTSYNHGLALHYYIVCDQCFVATPFYTLPQDSTPHSDTHNTIKFGHNMLQILGGRLVGIGKSGLDFVNTFIGLPSTLSNRAFTKLSLIYLRLSRM